MERREAPGVCETPLGSRCDRGASRAADVSRGVTARSVRLSGWVCEAQPEARAPCDGGFATTTTRTLRLPALHRDPFRARLPEGIASLLRRLESLYSYYRYYVNDSSV